AGKNIPSRSSRLYDKKEATRVALRKRVVHFTFVNIFLRREMGVFPGFGSWIKQNTQQPPKGESKKSGNVKTKSASETNTHEERDEMKEQLKLWRDADKKERQWQDPPPKVKGVCHMNMEFTLGLPPQAAYDVLTNPDNQSYSRLVNERELLKNSVERWNDAKKDVAWNIFSWSRAIPISLFLEEDEKDLSVVYMKDKMKFMKVFEGKYKVEPIYVDSARFCKQIKPKNREEYRKCSGGQGRIASKVVMDQYFQPSSLYNLPPLSWYIRGITIKTTTNLLEDLQDRGLMIRRGIKMGVFPGFGGWINQSTQKTLIKAESKRSGNVKSKSRSEINTQGERDEMKEQLKLWRDANKIEQWHDPPPKVKVEIVEGLCFMDMELILGLPPQAAYDVLTNPDNKPFSRIINGRELLHNKSRKVVTNDGSRYVVEVEKEVAWNFLSWSRAIPITLDFAESQKDLSTVYMKKKMMLMKDFEGSWKVEPIFVDSQRLCKQRLPKTREEYRECSGGQGKIAWKVKMNLTFMPSSPFNLPPASWYIRGTIIKTTKALLQDLQAMGAKIRVNDCVFHFRHLWAYRPIHYGSKSMVLEVHVGPIRNILHAVTLYVKNEVMKIELSKYFLWAREMGIFPVLGGWINQITQQPLQAESKKSGNAKSKSTSETNTHEGRDEMKEQLKLWRDANKKKQWHDPPAKVKVETRNDLERGLCHMQMEFTLGLLPQAAYDVLTNPDNQSYSRMIKGRELLENVSRKVTSEDSGKGQIVESEKALSWNFLSFSGTIPIHLYFIENPRNFSVQFGKEKKAMRFMEMFEGSYKVEPMYVDSERLCKNIKPKSREEYRKCSGGQGRIASKVTFDQIFKPSFSFQSATGSLSRPPRMWSMISKFRVNLSEVFETLYTVLIKNY
ncbi:unnamed protein product, partial [Thlaspi arvense]